MWVRSDMCCRICLFTSTVPGEHPIQSRPYTLAPRCYINLRWCFLFVLLIVKFSIQFQIFTGISDPASRCLRRVLYERQSVFDLSWWLLSRLGGLVSGPNIRRGHSGSVGALERVVARPYPLAALITPLMAPPLLVCSFHLILRNEDGEDGKKIMTDMAMTMGLKIRLWPINIPPWVCLKPISTPSYTAHIICIHSGRG